jgi:hypothetical protein
MGEKENKQQLAGRYPGSEQLQYVTLPGDICLELLSFFSRVTTSYMQTFKSISVKINKMKH